MAEHPTRGSTVVDQTWDNVDKSLVAQQEPTGYFNYKRAALDLAKVIEIKPSSFENVKKEGQTEEQRYAQAYEIMSHICSIPLLPAQRQRHQYINEILQNTAGYFGVNSLFMREVQGTVSVLLAMPNTLAFVNSTNEELINDYKLLDLTLKGLTYAGMGSFVAPVPSVARGAITGATKGLEGAVGSGAARQAGATALGAISGVKNVVVR